jgi:hypothetical protein
MPGGIWLLLVTGLLVGVWAWATRARERVDLISREVCADLKLQRLDESVTLRRISLQRTEQGIRLRRVFSFEFSASGADRRRGYVCLLGSLPAWVRVDHPGGEIFIDINPPGSSQRCRK